MKTPKEKAEELVENHYDKMFYLRDGYNSSEVYEVAKQCALIAVDEIMKAVGWEYLELGVDRGNYWQEVKIEIKKLS